MNYQSTRPTTEIGSELERLTYSAYLYGFDDDDMSNPILSLDSSSRTAFLLHHLFGYNIEEAASLAEMSQEEFCTHLRYAYLQLIPSQLGLDAYLNAVAQPALA